ncbi:hypothetical protein K502DRAFT_321292 [Neoconidiobolus thromboides FSU 785]|nr:hypothetical protein K502DRAFT_321292 [Neoconidiobolus thromboides FSU 785]
MLKKAIQSLPKSGLTKSFIRHNTTIATPVKPRMSAFRGGLLGFLLGSTIAGASGYYLLINDYQIASGLMLNSVKELQSNTEKVRKYAGSIETVSKDLRHLKETTVKLEQIDSLKAELRKLYNSIGVDMLELKAQISELEKELHHRSKSN